MLKNLRIFTGLCGQKAMPNVIIATTMWGKVGMEEGAQREQELKEGLWKDMLADGCRTERFENTYESAWHVIGSLAQTARTQLLLPRQIVDSHMPLQETEAGTHAGKTTPKVPKSFFSKLFKFFSG